MFVRHACGRFNASIVVIVTGVSSSVKIPEGGSAMGCEKRSYGDMLREEKVIEASHDGSNERAAADHRQVVCSE